MALDRDIEARRAHKVRQIAIFNGCVVFFMGLFVISLAISPHDAPGAVPSKIERLTVAGLGLVFVAVGGRSIWYYVIQGHSGRRF